MSRDYTQLRVFTILDELVVDIYVLTRSLPDEEKYGLQAQLRRAAVSAPTNIVEGSVRRSDKAYLTFLETSLGSTCEVRYLLSLTVRLGFLNQNEIDLLTRRYTEAIKALQKLITAIEADVKRAAQRRKAARLKAES